MKAKNGASRMQRTVSRLGLSTLNVIVFFIEEAWIIAAVAILPFVVALVVVVLLLSLFSLASTYLCSQSDLPDFISRWIDKKKSGASDRLSKAVTGTIWTACLTTAIVVSPATSAVMLSLAGVSKQKAYIADLFFSFVSGLVWCMIYGGGLLVLRKLL